jgi:SCF-associated factor 1
MGSVLLSVTFSNRHRDEGETALHDGLTLVGQLDGSLIAFRAESWENKHCQVPEPTRIPLPCRAEAISCGRRHLLVLDADNLIWDLRDWGRVGRIPIPYISSCSTTGCS